MQNEVYSITTFIFFWNSEFWNRNSDFLIFQQRNSKKIQPESLESKTKSEFCFQWGFQKLERKIGIPNQVRLPAGGTFDDSPVRSM